MGYEGCFELWLFEQRQLEAQATDPILKYRFSILLSIVFFFFFFLFSSLYSQSPLPVLCVVNSKCILNM